MIIVIGVLIVIVSAVGLMLYTDRREVRSMRDLTNEREKL